MLVPRYWAEHRIQLREDRGPQTTIRRWGWSGWNIKSIMPPMSANLTLRELRNLVAYLATLKWRSTHEVQTEPDRHL
jgi:hypothetical protein